MVDSICSRRKLIILIVTALCLIPTALASAQSESAAAVRSLAALLPDLNAADISAIYDFLPGGRLFVAADRLILIDLNDMEIIAEAELPDSASTTECEFAVRYDRIEALENSFFWLTRIYASECPGDRYYQFNDQLELIREIDLWEYTKAKDMAAPDLSSDGSQLFYVDGADDLHRKDFNNGDDLMLVDTHMGFGQEINSVYRTRVINNGETVLFFGEKLIEQEGFRGGVVPTQLVFGTMSPDGEDLAIVNATEYNIPINANVLSETAKTPQTSPIMLIVPSTIEDYSDEPPIKTVYALDVIAKNVVEIQLQSSGEDKRATLSENGLYLATAVCEDRGDETFAFVARLYDTAGGELLDTIETGGLTGCDGAAVGISEADGLIRAVYREDAELFAVTIPFKN